MDYILWIVTACLVLVSFWKSKQKTREALNLAVKKFGSVLSLFLIVMVIYALIISFLPPGLIQQNLGRNSGLKGVFWALGMGSVSVMPGFAAFPLCAALKGLGIPYYILAAFSISLMNIGVITFPVDKRFLGFRVALARNAAALVVCLVVVLIFKWIFGES